MGWTRGCKMPDKADYSKDQADDRAKTLAGLANDGAASKFYEELHSMQDDVKTGKLSAKTYNDILKQADQSQTKTSNYDDINISKNPKAPTDNKDVRDQKGNILPQIELIDSAALNFKH